MRPPALDRLYTKTDQDLVKERKRKETRRYINRLEGEATLMVRTLHNTPVAAAAAAANDSNTGIESNRVHREAQACISFRVHDSLRANDKSPQESIGHTPPAPRHTKTTRHNERIHKYVYRPTMCIPRQVAAQPHPRHKQGRAARRSKARQNKARAQNSTAKTRTNLHKKDTHTRTHEHDSRLLWHLSSLSRAH